MFPGARIARSPCSPAPVVRGCNRAANRFQVHKRAAQRAQRGGRPLKARLPKATKRAAAAAALLPLEPPLIAAARGSARPAPTEVAGRRRAAAESSDPAAPPLLRCEDAVAQRASRAAGDGASRSCGAPYARRVDARSRSRSGESERRRLGGGGGERLLSRTDTPRAHTPWHQPTGPCHVTRSHALQQRRLGDVKPADKDEF